MDFEPFLNHLETNWGRNQQTIEAYRTTLNKFILFLQERSITCWSDVNDSIIGDYVEYTCQKSSPSSNTPGRVDSSIARRLAAISIYVEFVRANRAPNLRNPITSLSGTWQQKNDAKPLDDLTSKFQINGMTSLRNCILFRLYTASGLQIDEMHRLNRESIIVEPQVDPHEEQPICGLGEVPGKGDKRRNFPMDEVTLHLYFEYLGTRADNNPALFLSERRQRLSVRAIQYTLATCCKRL